MLKRLFWILCLLPIMAISSAFAVDCASNEFEYDGQCIENKFQITTTNDTDKFVFSMSAKGTFYIDWGDGNVELIDRANTTTMTEYSHDYDVADEYIIKFGGLATGYNNTVVYDRTYITAIIFGSGNYSPNNTNKQIKGISGSLGAIFPTLGDTTGLSGDSKSLLSIQPRFYRTFGSCSNIVSSIPPNLFSGLYGQMAIEMFYATFSGCTKLTGDIPGGLFANLSGSSTRHLFRETFIDCSGLSGTDIDDPNNPDQKYAIPPNLFSIIQTGTAQGEFYETFSSCSGLTGTIPGSLFAGVIGEPQISLFIRTFSGCYNLTGSIPGNLFAGVSGAPATYMFYLTFKGCSKLTGPIPDNLFAGIYGKGIANMFSSMFSGCTNLGKDRIGGTSRYYIPPELFAGIDKTSVTSGMMNDVFPNTGLLTTCPSGTNQYITGFESYFNGKKSCTECPVAYPDYDTTNQQCYAQVTFIDSDNNTLLKKEDVYYDAQNASGYNLPSYSPVKPDTVLDNWTTGDGTVIGSADLLTGNQVVYSDWGFHCDSGHYFHAGNEQICTAETKRTEHALVIKPDANHTYYIHATPNSEHDYTINSSSIHKMKVNYNGTIYNLHDASVYFSE